MKPACMKPVIAFVMSLLLSAPGLARADEASTMPIPHPLEAGAAAAMAGGRREFRLPAGTIVLDRGLTFRDLHDLIVDGTGTTLVCRDWRHTALNFEGCRDITLRGVTIDYDPLPFTQGTVTARANDGAWLEVAIHDGYRDYDEGFRGGNVPGFAHVFAAQTQRWKATAPDIYPRSITAAGLRRWRIEPHRATGDAVDVGDRIVLDHRGAYGIRFLRCENVRVEAATVLAAPGVALICRYMKGDNRFSYDVRPGAPPAGATEPRLMSSCADGFNYAAARAGPVLEHCRFSFMGDDSVNLHGPTFMVAEQISDREIIVGWRWNQEHLPWLIQPGDTVRRLASGSFSTLGEASLESFTHETMPEPRWLETVRSHWPQAPEIQGIFRLTLREPLACEPGDAIDLPGINAPNFRIEGCEFRDHRARGMRVAASHGMIRDNLFTRIKWSGISLGPEYGYWREAGWVSDVTIRGNRFAEVNLGVDREAAAVISANGRGDEGAGWSADCRGNERIVIEANRFDRCGGDPVRAEKADKVRIE